MRGGPTVWVSVDRATALAPSPSRPRSRDSRGSRSSRSLQEPLTASSGLPFPSIGRLGFMYYSVLRTGLQTHLNCSQSLANFYVHMICIQLYIRIINDGTDSFLWRLLETEGVECCMLLTL